MIVMPKSLHTFSYMHTVHPHTLDACTLHVNNYDVRLFAFDSIVFAEIVLFLLF